MFGMGFTEILLIAIVAILFLGPDKLPDAMVSIAKFIKGAKKAIGDAKNAIDDEVKISELKEEAMGYKAKLDAATDELQGFKNINPMNSLNDELDSIKSSLTEIPKATPVEPKQDESAVTKRKDEGDR
ncbi:Sec-independent protein translocase subunit TatB [Sulfurovum sp. bin170]|uniref:Sec-independent protein translocase protein TatB n=1 Tax=Sulfurovum sp. bin170 TaxID=2695268 RepID=UPI0013E00A32|nr:Sec-independent protein translocase protein TatB [Sulfurovum sp. bin170]NEW60630.1 Sec-independent protein translocase subunit TatB [Sulfurovum sp. bin170]